MHATCPVHFILDLVTLVIFSEENKLEIPHYAVFSTYGTSCLLSSYTPNLYSSVRVKLVLTVNKNELCVYKLK
jgi:hypothetical protein